MRLDILELFAEESGYRSDRGLLVDCFVATGLHEVKPRRRDRSWERVQARTPAGRAKARVKAKRFYYAHREAMLARAKRYMAAIRADPVRRETYLSVKRAWNRKAYWRNVERSRAYNREKRKKLRRRKQRAI